MGTACHNDDDFVLDLILALLEHIDARTAEVELLTSKDIIDAFEEDYPPQQLREHLDAMVSAGLLTSDPDPVNLTTLGRTFLYVAEDKDLVQKVRDRLGDCSLSELVTALTGDGSESAKEESQKEETEDVSSTEAADDSEPIYIASTDFTEPQSETELNDEPTAKKSWLSRLFGLFQRQSSKKDVPG